MIRRHSGMTSNNQNNNQTAELEKELERIKERLRLAENDLMFERNARLNGLNLNLQPQFYQNQSQQPKQRRSPSPESSSSTLKRQKEELDYLREQLRKSDDIKQKYYALEEKCKYLEERLESKQQQKSNIGWIKDDIDLEKDTVLNQLKEIEKLKETVSAMICSLLFFA
jgi:hypothetical protein